MLKEFNIKTLTIIVVTVFMFVAMSATSYAETCKNPKPTKIKITPVTQKLTYDYSKPLAQMQLQSAGAHNPYGANTKTITQGFMMGAIRMVPSVRISGFEVPHSGATCLWYDEIKIGVEINPRIVIGKEVYDNPCLRQSVLDHERKHVIVDRKVVNQFSRNVGYRLKRALQTNGSYIGFIPRSEKKAEMAAMQALVKEIAQQEFQKLNAMRVREQKKVDTREEYERVSRQCPAAQRRLMKDPHYHAIAR